MFLGIYRYTGRFKDRPSVPIPYNSKVTSTFYARTSLNKHVRSFLICLFSFLSPFYAGTYRTFFMAPLLVFQAHFFCFCNTCLFVTFRTSSDVVGPNIILLYSRRLQSPSATTAHYEIGFAQNLDRNTVVITESEWERTKDK